LERAQKLVRELMRNCLLIFNGLSKFLLKNKCSDSINRTVVITMFKLQAPAIKMPKNFTSTAGADRRVLPHG
jgi:hypothetical protein